MCTDKALTGIEGIGDNILSTHSLIFSTFFNPILLLLMCCYSHACYRNIQRQYRMKRARKPYLNSTFNLSGILCCLFSICIFIGAHYSSECANIVKCFLEKSLCNQIFLPIIFGFPVLVSVLFADILVRLLNDPVKDIVMGNKYGVWRFLISGNLYIVSDLPLNRYIGY